MKYKNKKQLYAFSQFISKELNKDTENTFPIKK